MKNEVRDKDESLQRLDKKYKELEQKFQESVSNAKVFRLISLKLAFDVHEFRQTCLCRI